MPITRAPRQSTWPLLESTSRSTEKLSWAVLARMPLTLFAEIATPMPVPQIRTARSASPAATIRAAPTAVCA